MHCKYCGGILSDNAHFCEHCGNSIIDDHTNETRKKSKTGIALALSAILFLSAAIIIAISDGNTSPKSNNPTTSANYSSTEDNSYREGVYKVGTDIDAGEYFVYCTSSISCYCEVSSDSTGKLTSIIANDNIDTFSFITVESGQYLKVTGGQFVKASDAKVPGADSNGIYGAGMYRVGIDIPAGEYKVTCTSDYSCYFEVSSDSSGSMRSIVSNDNVDTFSYITVSEGQYLSVTRGSFAPA